MYVTPHACFEPHQQTTQLTLYCVGGPVAAWPCSTAPVLQIMGLSMLSLLYYLPATDIFVRHDALSSFPMHMRLICEGISGDPGGRLGLAMEPVHTTGGPAGKTYTTVHDFQRGRHSLTHSTMLTCPLATKDEKPGIHALYGALFSILWRDGRRASALASAHRCH